MAKKSKVGKARKITAESINLVDSNGKLRALMTASTDNVTWEMYGGDGLQRISIGIDQRDIPHISLLSKDGKVLLGVGYDEHERAAISISDSSGKVRILVGLAIDGRREILILDDNGKSVFRVG